MLAAHRPVPAVIETLAPDAWVATNTLSLSTAALATTLTRPERFISLHFFNPVPASKLVEIVVGARTPREPVDLSRDWVTDLGRTATRCPTRLDSHPRSSASRSPSRRCGCSV